MALKDGPLTGAPIGFPKGAKPKRPILPTFNDSLGEEPSLVYLVTVGNSAATLTIKGSNLADIAQVGFIDGSAAGNSAPAPVVSSVLATETEVVVTMDASSSSSDDYWALILGDSDGNGYTSPSLIRIVEEASI